MTAWPEVVLGDVAELFSGFPFKSNQYVADSSAIRLLRGDNVGQGQLRWDDAKMWPLDQRAECSNFELREHDVVLAMDRPWVSAGLKFAAVRKSDLPSLLVQRVARLRSGPQLDQRYLRHVVGAPSFTGYVKGITTGANVPHISGPDIRRYRFRLPPVPTQRRIASILSAYEDLIENNTRRIEILEEMARSLYREWFVHFRFPGHEKVKLVGSELGNIPEGWTRVPLGELAVEVRDSVQPGDLSADTPYFGLEHLPRRSIALHEWGNFGDVASTKLRAKPGDILFGKIRPYFHKVGVCPVPAVCSSDTIILRPLNDAHFALCVFAASSDEFVAQASATANGAKMPRADWRILAKYPVPVPDSLVLLQFEKFGRGVIELIKALGLKTRVLRQTRDLLLPKLISGEIDVDSLDLPETS